MPTTEAIKLAPYPPPSIGPSVEVDHIDTSERVCFPALREDGGPALQVEHARSQPNVMGKALLELGERQPVHGRLTPAASGCWSLVFASLPA
ncbi:hypothetical protein [Haloechinothrix salitolerans]|uniref:Uncharacterized protein n=1 Tax=Haloechinothrix salitolerans TaxID=926830 RepID=A0ABW2BVA0_9PSEU